MFSFHCDKVADKSTMACVPLVCIFLQIFSLLARLFMHGTHHSLKCAGGVVARTTLQLIVAPRSVSIAKHWVIGPRIARNQRHAVFAWKAIQRPCAPIFALARISKKTRAIRHMLKSPKPRLAEQVFHPHTRRWPRVHQNKSRPSKRRGQLVKPVRNGVVQQ